MNQYFIKIALHGVSPMIWRRLRVGGHTSLADLHHIVQITMGWDNDYLHCFHIYGEDYGIAYDGGMSFSHNARRVFIDDFEFDVGDRFTYTYNFTIDWLCDIRIERIEQTSKKVPWCIGGSGRQGDDARYYKTDELIAMVDVIAQVAKANETTTVGDFLPLIEYYEAVRFSRQAVNKQLMESIPRLT